MITSQRQQMTTVWKQWNEIDVKVCTNQSK